MKSYQRKTILVASPCMMQSMAAVLVVHGGGANANQRWWSVGWKIAKEQRDVTKDFWNFVCQIWCSYACVHKFLYTQ